MISVKSIFEVISLFIVIIRTIILYTLVVFVMRLMGKRQIGELQPYELAITIMLSDLASLPMQDTRLPLILGIIPIITLLISETIVSEVQLKSPLARKIIDGKPCILIEEGKINAKVLKNQRINLDDLMESIRLSGYFNVQDIQFAILENNGKISIFPKDANSPVTKKDLKLQPSPEQNIPIILVVEGKINHNGLKKLNQTEKWLHKYLKSSGVKEINDLYIALINSNGKLYYETNRKGNIKEGSF